MKRVSKENGMYGRIELSSVSCVIDVFLYPLNGSYMLSFNGPHYYVDGKTVFEITEIMLHQTDDVRNERDVIDNILHMFIILSKMNHNTALNKIKLSKKLNLINSYRSFDQKGSISVYQYSSYLTSNELSKDISKYLKDYYDYDTLLDTNKPLLELIDGELTVINDQLAKIIIGGGDLENGAFSRYDDSCYELESEEEIELYNKKNEDNRKNKSNI